MQGLEHDHIEYIDPVQKCAFFLGEHALASASRGQIILNESTEYKIGTRYLSCPKFNVQNMSQMKSKTPHFLLGWYGECTSGGMAGVIGIRV